MKTTALILAASAALTSAQVTYNNGTYTCAKPNAAYCAGSSLGTDIIIRCDANGKGQPGRCTDNLAGQPPLGVQPALCWQTSETSGDAACEKNCVVYAPTTFTLPKPTCTPFYTASSSSSSTSSTKPPTTTTTKTTLTTLTTSCSTTSTTSKTSKPVPPPTGTGHPHPPPPPPPAGNGTVTSKSSSHTPVGPTKTSTPPPVVTAGAAVHQVGGTLALVGLVAAFFV
jgi:hypothetical protein